MAQLAIKGHLTRGKEVIEILEMLGGKIQGLRPAGKETFSWYYINGNGYIDYMHYSLFHDATFFALEKFLEKFPYKVGDKVQFKWATSCGSVFEVEKMRWVDYHVEYTIKRLWYNNCHSVVTAEDLQPYKEETMGKAVFDANAQCCDIMNHLIKKGTTEENLTIQDIRDNNAEWLLNKLQEMSAEGALQTISDLYDKLHRPQYPKTYKECFNICFGNHHPIIQVVGLDGLGNNKELFENFIKLKICRDAYWKIAGEQMGLGKPWEPDWDNYDDTKYCIYTTENIISLDLFGVDNKILAFPTEKTRNAFYKNFKELIEACKELL